MSRRNQNLYGERCHKINEDTELIGTSSERESRKSRRRTICLCTLCSVVLVLVAAAVVTLAVLMLVRNDAATPDQLPDDPYERALALLTDYPVIDGYVVQCRGMLVIGGVVWAELVHHNSCNPLLVASCMASSSL